MRHRPADMIFRSGYRRRLHRCAGAQCRRHLADLQRRHVRAWRQCQSRLVVVRPARLRDRGRRFDVARVVAHAGDVRQLLVMGEFRIAARRGVWRRPMGCAERASSNTVWTSRGYQFEFGVGGVRYGGAIDRGITTGEAGWWIPTGPMFHRFPAGTQFQCRGKSPSVTGARHVRRRLCGSLMLEPRIRATHWPACGPRVPSPDTEQTAGTVFAMRHPGPTA